MSYAPLPFPVDKLSIARGRADARRPTPRRRASTSSATTRRSPSSREKRTAAVLVAAAGTEQAGCGVVLKSAGGDNYRALVQRYQDCGATVLFDQGTPTPATFSFLDAMRVEGYEPDDPHRRDLVRRRGQVRPTSTA